MLEKMYEYNSPDEGFPIGYFNIEAHLRYCDNCGAELYWPYRTVTEGGFLRVSKTVKGEVMIEELKEHADMIRDIVESTKCCPICRHKLETGKGFYGQTESFLRRGEAEFIDKLKDAFYDMRLDRREFYINKDKITSKNEYEKCIHQIKDDLSDTEMLPIKSVNAEEVKNSVSTLCEYLSHAIELEQNIYTVEKRLQMILGRMPKIQRDAYYAMQDRRDELSKKVNEEEEQLENRIQEISDYSYAAFGLSLLAFPQQPIPPVRPAEPVYETPGFFNKKKVMERNSLLEQQYNDALRQYDVDSELYNSNIQAYQGECARISAINDNVTNDLSRRKQALEMAARTEHKTKVDQIKREYCDENWIPEVLVKQMLENEIQLAKNTYKELLVAKERYYSPDIIFGKYREFAPVATIYEYLKAGRCTTLEGPDGAYNLYEAELRSNTIIAKLDVVIEKLEEIKNTQYMLCNALEKINSSLTKIDEKMDKACVALEKISNSVANIENRADEIAKNTAVIAYNTETTAFYSKMTASISAAMLLWG